MPSDYAHLMQPWYVKDQADRERTDEELPAGQIAAVHSRAQAALASELIARIHAQSPDFFEALVIDVLLAMGYGGRRRDLAQQLGRTGDGGVDGVIAQDELGLDVIYIQAKRLKPGGMVPVADVRDFAGSLDAHQASKGVFVSTAQFTEAAREFVGRLSRRVVLVDGLRLSDLMIRHNIGVRVKESYQIKRIDADYFSPPLAASRKQQMISASIQPRR
jgi:restriction system protein